MYLKIYYLEYVLPLLLDDATLKWYGNLHIGQYIENVTLVILNNKLQVHC